MPDPVALREIISSWLSPSIEIHFYVFHRSLSQLLDWLRALNWEILTAGCGEVERDGFVTIRVLIIIIECTNNRGGCGGWHCHGHNRVERDVSRTVINCPEYVCKSDALQSQGFTDRSSRDSIPNHVDILDCKWVRIRIVDHHTHRPRVAREADLARSDEVAIGHHRWSRG